MLTHILFDVSLSQKSMEQNYVTYKGTNGGDDIFSTRNPRKRVALFWGSSSSGPPIRLSLLSPGIFLCYTRLGTDETE